MNLILGSGSPRRKELLATLGIKFETLSIGVEEKYPKGLIGHEIALYLAELKSEAYPLKKDEVLLTADTVVWCKGQSLEKANSEEEALNMLKILRGTSHTVYTGCCLRSAEKKLLFFDETTVYVKPATDSQLLAYIRGSKPFDKAGAYGIQDSFGLQFIEKIEGSFYNVVGLPTHLITDALMQF